MSGERFNIIAVVIDGLWALFRCDVRGRENSGGASGLEALASVVREREKG